MLEYNIMYIYILYIAAKIYVRYNKLKKSKLNKLFNNKFIYIKIKYNKKIYIINIYL